MSVINVFKEWQTLVAVGIATIAAFIAWNAYRATARQVHLTELSQARREEEEALRDFEANSSPGASKSCSDPLSPGPNKSRRVRCGHWR